MTVADTAPAPTRQIVAPWARVEEIPSTAPRVHDPDYEELLWQASELLYHLTGRQWAGEAQREVGLEPYRAARCWTQTQRMAAASWPASPTGLLRDVDSRDGWRTVQLPDPPVTSVDEVLIDDQPVPFRAQLPVGMLTRPDGGSWPDRGLAVRYRHGLAPPTGGHRSALLLTVELGKAWADDKDCRLPKRIQSVTREGVSISFSEQFEALDNGRLGLFEVDSWIVSVNPHRLQRRASVWTPDTAARRSRR